jgi:outer membrane protein TolC
MEPTLKGTQMQLRTNYRSIAIVLCAILGIATVATVAECQSIQSQVAAEQNWKTVPAGGEVARPADEATLAHWWTVFNDPVLTSLEERALKANLDLRTALSSIDQARANRLSASGSYLPSVNISGSSTGNRTSNWSGGGLTASNSAQLQASWEPDFFGAIRKNVASNDASIQAAQEGLRNTMVTLTAELATDYINLRSYQAQLAVTQANLVKYRETYEMTLEKRRSGLAADLDVAQALETVQSTEATVPVLETSIEQTMSAMAICWRSGQERSTPSWPHRSRSPSFRRKSPSAFPPTCSAAAPTSSRPSARSPPSLSRSASPRPISIPPSR